MNPFQVFHDNKKFYLKISQHTDDCADELNRRIRNFDSLQEKDAELELYHLILKHARHCDLSHCVAQQMEANLQHLILSFVSPSYPLLVCRLDLVKQDTLNEGQLILLLDYACHLWSDPRIYVRRKSMELVQRIIPLLPQVDISLILQYLQTLDITFTDLDKILSSEYTEFFHTPMTLDRECIKRLVQIVLSIISHHPFTFPRDTTPMDLPIQNLLPLLFEICCANDDDTVDFMYTVLTIFKGGDTHLLKSLEITPHRVFLYFLKVCGGTHDILIDFLLDKDSEFLSFFIQYLKYAVEDGDVLLDILDEDERDRLLTVVVNITLVLEKDAFPYNTAPLLRRLVQLEELLL
ncbi:hypothetical protein INT47_012913 [Mucor saturninus]|uniref:Protein Lines N-terminal domain-containing protein n=1 Tax=Mucor saturninus TaxID=64648 RepID=A0A8H7QN54_9FUNG|nr:hypothetical protein INT47_012913 [Mucor saturninus]